MPTRPAAEVESLRELLSDFAAPGWGPGRVAEAYDVMQAMESALSGAYEAVAYGFAETYVREIGLPDSCRACLMLAHRILYGQLLTNAGEVRRPGDAGGSAVHFGGIRGARREPRFTGTPAGRIDADLDLAFAHLEDCRDGRTDEAPDRAILFYADLSRVHPFYDGNGRSGRFVVSVYLHLHGWLVEWDRLGAREGELMRRINNVNEKRTAAVDYETLLLRYWRRYVVRTDAYG